MASRNDDSMNKDAGASPGKTRSPSGDRRSGTGNRAPAHRAQYGRNHADIITAMLGGSFGLSYVIDREGKFITANAAALKLLGYRKADLPSLSIVSLLDPEDYRRAASHIKSIIRVGYSEELVRFRLKSSRGGHVWIETIAMAATFGNRKNVVQGIARDITSIKRDEFVVRAQRDIAIILGEAVNLQEAINRVLDIALGFESIDTGGVYLVDQQTGAFDLAAYRGIGEEFIGKNSHFEADSEYAAFIRSGKSSHMTHAQIRSRLDPMFAGEGLRSLCVVPVVHHGSVIASFNLASRSIDRIPATIIAGFESIAFQIGTALVRIRAEEAQHESEERYRTIIEDSIIGIALSDMNDIILVNRATAVMLGRTVEELMAMSFEDIFTLVHPDDRDMVRRRNAKRMEGRESPARYQFRFIRKNGEILWVDVATTMITYRGRRAQMAMIADITERVRVEEQLRESGIRLSMLSDNLPGGLVYQIDTGVDGRERRFTYISAGVEQLHGIGAVDALNDAMTVYDQIVGEDRLMVAEREAVAIANMSSFNAEVRVRIPTGEIRWRYFASAPRRLENRRLIWDGIEIDITEWKLAEQELERERDRARLYLDSAGVMMVLIDPAGTVLLVNKKASEVLGREEEDIIGKNWFDVAIPDREREFVSRVFRELMEGAIEPQEYVENRVVKKTGEERLVAWHNIVIRDDAGRITGTLSSGEDITERRRAEEAKKRSDQMFRAVIENSYDAVTMIAADGTILYDSPSITRILGYLHNDRLGRNVAEFVIPAERNNMENGLRAFAEKFGAVMHYMARFVHKDGSTRWVEGVRTNLLNEPLVHAIVVNYRDITERKEAEERLLQSLHEKDVLLAEVHHRVKNNLQSVISLFNINEEKIRDEQSRGVFHDIQGKVYSMALIHEMLYRSGDFTAIDMGPYIRELVNELFSAYSASPERITLNLRISDISSGSGRPSRADCWCMNWFLICTSMRSPACRKGSSRLK